MALINCSHCGKEISDKTSKCIHCGQPLKKDVPKKSTSNNPLWVRIIINVLLTFGFCLILYNLGVITTRYSGNYAFMHFLEFIEFRYLGLDFEFSILNIITLIYILGLFLSTIFNHNQKIVTVLFIGLLIGEVIFGSMVLLVTVYSPNINYFLIILYTIGWMFYVLKNNKFTWANKIKFSSNSRLDEIKKLKELLDMQAITEEEFNKMKENILNKEMKR